jgi:hypothetical protein
MIKIAVMAVDLMGSCGGLCTCCHSIIARRQRTSKRRHPQLVSMLMTPSMTRSPAQTTINGKLTKLTMTKMTN